MTGFSATSDYAGIAANGEHISLVKSMADLLWKAIITYEYLITFQQEIAVVWRRRLTATSLLLLSTRYTLMLTQLMDYIPPSDIVRRFNWSYTYQLDWILLHTGVRLHLRMPKAHSNILNLAHHSCRPVMIIQTLLEIAGFAQNPLRLKTFSSS